MSKSRHVILIGGGASVRDGLDEGLWKKIKGMKIWSLNYAFKFMPYEPNAQIWVDDVLWKHNRKDIKELKCRKVALKLDYYDNEKNLCFDLILATRDYTKFPQKTYSGRMGLVGTFALSLALKEGHNPIFILGYDYGGCHKSKRTHWYQDKVKSHKIRSAGVGHPEIYCSPDGKPNEFVKDYEPFVTWAYKKGVTIYNVSLKSKIPYFSKINYETFFTLIQAERCKM